MADYNYKLNLDEPVEVGSKFKPRSRGIGAQPEKEEPEADGWADMFYGLLKGYFGDEDEAKKALTTAPEKPSYDMDDALQTLKSVNLPSRISEPVIEGEPMKFSMAKPETYELEVDTIGNEALDRSGMRLVDVTDTEEYDGTSWSSGGALPQISRGYSGTAGTQTAGLSIGGVIAPGIYNGALKYDGSTWSISPATMAAIKDPEVINAIFFSERKIATERIGRSEERRVGKECRTERMQEQ